MIDKATSYDDLVQRLKELHCPTCTLSLFCASGRSGGESHWCRCCAGYFVPHLSRIVQCSGFPAKRKRYTWSTGYGATLFGKERRESSENQCAICTFLVPGHRYPPIVGFIAEDER